MRNLMKSLREIMKILVTKETERIVKRDALKKLMSVSHIINIDFCNCI